MNYTIPNTDPNGLRRIAVFVLLYLIVVKNTILSSEPKFWFFDNPPATYHKSVSRFVSLISSPQKPQSHPQSDSQRSD